MAAKTRTQAPDPKKEAILEEIAVTLAGYKKGPEDIRTQEEIADDLFDYLNAKLDTYCDS